MCYKNGVYSIICRRVILDMAKIKVKIRFKGWVNMECQIRKWVIDDAEELAEALNNPRIQENPA